MRGAFSDAILNIYSGSAPATADLPSTGELLAAITLAGGTVTHDEVGVRMVEALQITAVVEGQANGCTINGATFTFSHTNVNGETEDTAAIALALLINANPMVPAVAIAVLHYVYIISKFPGETITIVATGNTPPSLTHIITNTRNDALHLAAPVTGAIAKESGVWSGEALVTGTAGYFRLVRSTDDDDDSASAIRLQGSISTSGAELNLSNLNIVDGATVTIDTFALTEPAA